MTMCIFVDGLAARKKEQKILISTFSVSVLRYKKFLKRMCVSRGTGTAKISYEDDIMASKFQPSNNESLKNYKNDGFSILGAKYKVLNM